MASRYAIKTQIPAGLHGRNLEDEIRAATGLQNVDVTHRSHENALLIAINGEKPRAELEALEARIREVVAAHQGMTEDQALDLSRRTQADERLRVLAEAVQGGRSLTDTEVKEAVGHLIVNFAPLPPRFKK